MSFATEHSVIREDLLPFSEVNKQTSIPLYKWFVGFHFFFTSGLPSLVMWEDFPPLKQGMEVFG